MHQIDLPVVTSELDLPILITPEDIADILERKFELRLLNQFLKMDYAARTVVAKMVTMAMTNVKVARPLPTINDKDLKALMFTAFKIEPILSDARFPTPIVLTAMIAGNTNIRDEVFEVLQEMDSGYRELHFWDLSNYTVDAIQIRFGLSEEAAEAMRDVARGVQQLDSELMTQRMAVTTYYPMQQGPAEPE